MASRKRTPKPAKAAETPEQEPVAATAPAPEAETVSDTAPVTETAAGAPEPASEPGTAAAAPAEPETAAVAPEPAPEMEAPAPAQGDDPEMPPPESAGEEAVVAASPPATLETLVSGLKAISEAVSNVASKPVSEGGQAKIWNELGEARDPVPVTAISDDVLLEDFQVTVVGPAKGFRRAGRPFGPEAVTFPASDLTHEQLRALMNERELIVRVALIAD